MPETDVNFSGEEEISQVNQFYTRTSGKKRVEELKNKSRLNKRTLLNSEEMTITKLISMSYLN